MADRIAIVLPPSLAAEQQGNVAILRLNRPQKRNALDDDTIVGIEKFFSAPPEGVGAACCSPAKASISPPASISAELEERDIAQGIAHSSLWHRAFEKIQFGKVPVVAVLHGAVVGGGLELAAAAHVRVAERSAYYALPEGSRGIYVGGGGSVRLPRLIGVARMMDMMLTGRTYSAEEGQAMGLTTYLVEPGKGFAKGLELAQRIAANAPLTNFAVMQALPRIAESDPASRLRHGGADGGHRAGRPGGQGAPARIPGEARAEGDALEIYPARRHAGPGALEFAKNKAQG